MATTELTAEAAAALDAMDGKIDGKIHGADLSELQHDESKSTQGDWEMRDGTWYRRDYYSMKKQAPSVTAVSVQQDTIVIQLRAQITSLQERITILTSERDRLLKLLRERDTLIVQLRARIEQLEGGSAKWEAERRTLEIRITQYMEEIRQLKIRLEGTSSMVSITVIQEKEALILQLQEQLRVLNLRLEESGNTSTVVLQEKETLILQLREQIRLLTVQVEEKSSMVAATLLHEKEGVILQLQERITRIELEKDAEIRKLRATIADYEKKLHHCELDRQRFTSLEAEFDQERSLRWQLEEQLRQKKSVEMAVVPAEPPMAEPLKWYYAVHSERGKALLSSADGVNDGRFMGAEIVISEGGPVSVSGGYSVSGASGAGYEVGYGGGGHLQSQQSMGVLTQFTGLGGQTHHHGLHHAQLAQQAHGMTLSNHSSGGAYWMAQGQARLRVKLVEANGLPLPPMMMGGHHGGMFPLVPNSFAGSGGLGVDMDVVACLSVGGYEKASQRRPLQGTMFGAGAAVWDEEFVFVDVPLAPHPSFPMYNVAMHGLQITIQGGHGMMGGDMILGSGAASVMDLVRGVTRAFTIPLSNGGGVNVRVTALDFGLVDNQPIHPVAPVMQHQQQQVVQYRSMVMTLSGHWLQFGALIEEEESRARELVEAEEWNTRMRLYEQVKKLKVEWTRTYYRVADAEAMRRLDAMDGQIDGRYQGAEIMLQGGSSAMGIGMSGGAAMGGSIMMGGGSSSGSHQQHQQQYTTTTSYTMSATSAPTGEVRTTTNEYYTAADEEELARLDALDGKIDGKYKGVDIVTKGSKKKSSKRPSRSAT